jgi:hypothetical protein
LLPPPGTPDGLEADFEHHPDPLLPPPDEHSNANAHGILPMAVSPYRRGKMSGRPGKPRPHTRACTLHGFVLQDSSGGDLHTNVCVTKASLDE